MIFTWTILLARWGKLIDDGDFYAFILLFAFILDAALIGHLRING